MKISKLLQADLALLITTVIWGSTFAIIKLCLAQASPILFIALRFWVATAVTLICMPGVIRGISWATLRRGAILSILLLSGFIFQTLGLRGTTPSRSAFITCLSVLLVPLLGFFIFHHRPKLQTISGIALAGIGLTLLTWTSAEMKLGWGDGLTLLCALAFALYILFLGHYLPRSDYRQLVLLQMGGCAILGTILIPMLESPFLVWDINFTLYLFVTGVLATALGFYLQNRAQQYTTPNRAALIFSLEPLFAVLFAYLLLGHTLSGKEWIGGLLVLAGILTSEFNRTGNQSLDKFNPDND